MFFVFLSLAQIASSQVGNCATGRQDNLPGNAWTSCVACPAGKYKPGIGAYLCSACEVGKYQSLTGQAACIACGCGKAHWGIGATSSAACVTCNTGKYSGSSASECSFCGANTYGDTPGLCSCTACPPGSTSPTGSVGAWNCVASGCYAGYYLNLGSCLLCPYGTYKSTYGNQACTKCPDFMISPEGSTQESHCVYQTCAAGFFLAGGPCVQCAWLRMRFGRE